MKKVATSLIALVTILAATSAFAVSLKQAPPNAIRTMANTLKQNHVIQPHHVHAYIGCDDGNVGNAYYFYSDDRMGNLFDFGTGAQLTQVAFAHYGFGTPGPYNYDIELWDPSSCTFIGSKDNLVAADAADAIQVETVDLCGANLHSTGITFVGIDANTCNDPTDCYPDLLFDDQIDVVCPVLISNASTSAACYDLSSFNGPFLFEVQLDNCTTGAKTHSWGELRTIYR